MNKLKKVYRTCQLIWWDFCDLITELRNKIKDLKFKDEGGTPCGFRWWFRWNIAFWHLRQWSRYEGLSKNKKSFEDVMEFNRKTK